MKKTILAALLVAAFTTHSSVAKAACCGDGAVAAAATAASTVTLSGAIATAATGISASIGYAAAVLAWIINEGFGGVVAAVEGSMKINAVATADIMNAHKSQLLMGMVAQEKSRIAAEQSIATLPLVSQTVASGMYSRTGREKAAEVSSIANTSISNRHLNIQSTSGNVLNSYQNYVNRYGTGSAVPNADVLADSLLAGAGQRGAAVTYTYSNNQLQAAYDFINNAVDVAPPTDIPDAAANTIEGKRYRMLLRAEKARISLSLKSFGDAVAARTPIPGFAPGAKIGLAKTGDISYLEFLNHEVARRYNNPAWYEGVAGASPTNLSREALFMQALELHMRAEEMRRSEKMELLLAQINLSLSTSGNLRQQIDQQRSRIR